MDEKLTSGVEKELTAIGQKIEHERQRLEAENNIVEAESITKQVMRDDLGIKGDNRLLESDFNADTRDSYIDTLAPENLEKVKAKIDYLFTHGLKKGVEAARAELSPLELDAFHDSLVGRLYEELKNRGLVK
ncbi:MAG: hypothetical protein WDZ73_00305 [Candidatus Paceibacterota bacterium]